MRGAEPGRETRPGGRHADDGTLGDVEPGGRGRLLLGCRVEHSRGLRIAVPRETRPEACTTRR